MIWGLVGSEDSVLSRWRRAPLLVPVISLLFSRRLIARFGGRPRFSAAGDHFHSLSDRSGGRLCPVLEASFLAATFGMLPIGRRFLYVGLTLPTFDGS